MLILLPPSEGKTRPGRGRRLDLDRMSFPELTGARVRMIEGLVELCAGSPDAAGVLGLGVTQQDEVARNVDLWTAATARADRIYSGVLYDALDTPTLSTAARRRARTRMAVTSSLFGLLRPGDAIPAYRLSGDVSLPGLGSVAGWWRSHLEVALVPALGNGLLVDLRSSTYAAFWRPPPGLSRRSATVRVLHEVGGERRVVSHFNKATKGRLVRALLESGAKPRTPDGLADVLHDLGWSVELGPSTSRGVRLDVVLEP